MAHRRLVVWIHSPRYPTWSIPADTLRRLRDIAGPGWEVELIEFEATASGDGVSAVPEEVLAAVEDAEIYFGFGIPDAVVLRGDELRWVHSAAAGVRTSLEGPLGEADILFTNSAGIHGPPVAETVLGYLLHFARGLDLAVRSQARGEWQKAPFDAADAPVREVAGSTVGVVGLGGIGREVAWRAKALGATVVGLRRRPEPVAGVELLTGEDALGELLERSHFVVLTVPETASTRGLIGERELRRMGLDTVLVNVSRGALVDEEALASALRDGHIRGAALDVFSSEPLPSGHPLWTTPATLITPHTSAYTHDFWRREAALLMDNLERYRAGSPLRNVVDREAGY